MGIVSAAGVGIDACAEKFASGTQCFSPINDPLVSHLTARYAGLAHAWDGAPADPALGMYDRFVHLAAKAAREAVSRAVIDPAAMGPRMGLVLATCSGPMVSIEQHFARILGGAPGISAEGLFAKKYYSAAKVLAHVFGIGGIATTVVTACSASTAALGLAADLIRLGIVDAALVGGVDTFSRTTLTGFDGLRATTDGRCAPFSKPSGLNLGEGAGFFVLEGASMAEHRGATPVAEVLGFGLTNDAHHCTAPDPSGKGQAQAMLDALADAGLSPGDITYVNAHGTGTEANDKAETRALKRVFADRAESVPVSSTKSMVGHCLGAAGSVEAIASLLCAQRGVLPPTASFTEAREGCTLDYVGTPGRAWDAPRVFLSDNFAFGGNNASIALSASPGAGPSAPDHVYRGRVCITACGIVSAAGVGASALTQAMAGGAVCTSAVSYPGLPALTLGAVPEFDVRAIDRRLDIRGMDRSSVLALVAVKLALRESGFPEKPAALARLGFFLHLATGPSWGESEHVSACLRDGFHLDKVLAFPFIVPNSVTGNVAKSLMLTGHNTTLCPGGGGGLAGLGMAVAAVQAGHVQAIVSAAVDELSERIVADCHSAGNIVEGRAAPGEGAAAFMVETQEHADGRRARPLAYVRSVAHATETSHHMRPDADSSVLGDAIKRALQLAGSAPGEVRAVCCASDSGHEVDAVTVALGAVPARVVDAGPCVGRPEAAWPLLNVAAVLGSASTPGDVVLAVASSANGVDCVMVIERA